MKKTEVATERDPKGLNRAFVPGSFLVPPNYEEPSSQTMETAPLPPVRMEEDKPLIPRQDAVETSAPTIDVYTPPTPARRPLERLGALIHFAATMGIHPLEQRRFALTFKHACGTHRNAIDCISLLRSSEWDHVRFVELLNAHPDRFHSRLTRFVKNFHQYTRAYDLEPEQAIGIMLDHPELLDLDTESLVARMRAIFGRTYDASHVKRVLCTAPNALLIPVKTIEQQIHRDCTNGIDLQTAITRFLAHPLQASEHIDSENDHLYPGASIEDAFIRLGWSQVEIVQHLTHFPSVQALKPRTVFGSLLLFKEHLALDREELTEALIRQLPTFVAFRDEYIRSSVAEQFNDEDAEITNVERTASKHPRWPEATVDELANSLHRISTRISEEYIGTASDNLREAIDVINAWDELDAVSILRTNLHLLVEQCRPIHVAYNLGMRFGLSPSTMRRNIYWRTANERERVLASHTALLLPPHVIWEAIRIQRTWATDAFRDIETIYQIDPCRHWHLILTPLEELAFRYEFLEELRPSPKLQLRIASVLHHPNRQRFFSILHDTPLL